MLKMIVPSEFQSDSACSPADIGKVCRLIPPLWDLRNFVAVNPFLGFSSQTFEATAKVVEDGYDAKMLPGLEYFHERWKAGDFGQADLSAACRGTDFDVESLQNILTGNVVGPTRISESLLSFAERHDLANGTDWNDFVIRSAAKWCAVYAADGGKFANITDGKSLFESWIESAKVDRSPEIAGLRGFRAWIAKIPTNPEQAITHLLVRLEIPASQQEAYLYRLLCGVYGWASYFRRIAWEINPQDNGSVIDLLAIRICMDAAVAELLSPAHNLGPSHSRKEIEDESAKLVLQNAFEQGFTRRLVEKIQKQSAKTTKERPKVQAVFCIDVRSEPLRRHLEAESPEIETRGFAGFFGVALNWKSNGEHSARCPVLLKPGITLERNTTVDESVATVLTHMQNAPGAAFSFVETVGLAYGLRLTSNTIGEGVKVTQSEGEVEFNIKPTENGAGISASARLNLAAGILKNMGFTDKFAKVVLLCGHEGHSANNAHAAGLDCGACGGHGGAINARIAAAVLNDGEVRVNLPSLGWNVPSDTYFLAGVHDTSTDEVRLLNTKQASIEHRQDIRQLIDWLDGARKKVQAERAISLGLGEKSVGIMDRLLRRRARDWSEVRPEWALAKNAAFIAARRHRTRGIDLEGRVFLHEYDASADSDDSILTLIMAAPMVVASWINLQYFASTVDNVKFGSGDKAIHHRVGSHGVVLGNGGDLRTGLPLQSVHSAAGKWFHEPLRLQVILESPTVKIDRVLQSRSEVRELVENGWIKLFALQPDSSEIARLVPGRGWEKF